MSAIVQQFKHSLAEKHLCITDYAKAFDCVDNNKLWKTLKEMGIPDPLNLSPDKPVYASRINSQNPVLNN